MNVIKSLGDIRKLQSASLGIQNHQRKKRVRASFRLGCWLKNRKGKRKNILLLLTGKGAGLTALKRDLFIQSNAGSNGTFLPICPILYLFSVPSVS